MSTVQAAPAAISIPTWLRIILYPFAWVFMRIVFACWWMQGQYYKALRKRAFRKEMQLRKAKKELVKKIKALVYDFQDIGRRSKFIPKEIKTNEQMREHIVYWYGDELASFNLTIHNDLKLKPLGTSRDS